MKQSNASKTLLAIVTILTVMMALLVPSPAYAAKEPPPPPPPPSNDTGGKISGPSHSAKDIPNDTTVVVTANGTPVSLAAQLATDAVNPPLFKTGLVKYCPVTGLCSTFDDVQSAINFIKTKTVTPTYSGATGTLYVDTTYDASGKFRLIPYFNTLGPLSLDQASPAWKDQAMSLVMQGGVNIATYAKSGVGTSTLNQTFNIKNINDASNLTVDSFVFNIVAATLGTDVLSVANSNHVTLSNLTINDSNLLGNGIYIYNNSNDIKVLNSVVNDTNLIGNGIDIANSGDVKVLGTTVNDSNPAGSGILIDTADVTLGGPNPADKVTVNRSGAGLGDGIKISNAITANLVNVTVTDSNSGGSGILLDNITDVILGGSGNEQVTVNRSGGLYGDGITIKDSGAEGSISLQNVTVTNTNTLLGDGIHITGSHDIFMDNVSATSENMFGAYLDTNSDGLSITDNGIFSNSGYAGLYVSNQTGDVYLYHVTADANGKNVLDLLKYATPGLASGAAFVDNAGTLGIDSSTFNNNATAGLWVQNQTNPAASSDALAELDGATDTILLYGDNAIGNGFFGSTITDIPLLDFLGWTGGSFIDGDTGNVIIKNSNFSGNNGNGLQTYATDGKIVLKNVTADKNAGEGAILNTYFDLTDGFTYGEGKIIVTGDEPVGDNFSSQFNGNGGTGLEMFAGGFAGVFNTEVLSNFNQVNDSLVDIAGGVGGLPGLEALLLNPGGAFIFSNSPDTVVVANSNFVDNNGEGLAVMTPGDIRVRNVNASMNDGMGAFLDNCLVSLGLQCTGQGTVDVSDSEFDANSYAGLVALASGVEVTPLDTESVSNGIFLDQVGASGNANFGALLVSPADVVVTNSTFDGSVAVEAGGGPSFQQATGLAVLSGGNVYLQSYEDLFGSEDATVQGGGEDFGVSADGNSGAGAVILSLGQLADFGLGSLFGDAQASDTISTNGFALVTSSDFTHNGGDGLTAVATLGIGVGNSLFADNGGNGLTALSLGDIYVIDSDFFDNGGDGAFATSLLGGVTVDPSIFAGNSGNGLTALAMDNIYIGDSGFFKNGKNGAFAASVLGNIGVDNSIFARNADNGLMALSTGGIILGNSGFFRNGGDGAFATSLDSIAVVDNTFAGNDGNGLTALALGDVTLGDSGFFRNGGDGAFVIAAVGGVDVDNSVFARNDGNGLTALTLSDILVGDSGFFGNGGDGAFTTSVFGGTEVLGSDFAGNGKNGLTALSLNDIFLAGVFAGGNADNGAVLVSGLGDVGVFESVFGNLPYGATVTGGGPVYSGNGENGLVAISLVGDVVLGDVAANQNGDNGIVAASLLGNIQAENVYADQNGIIGALLASVTGSVDVEESGFDNNGGVGLVAFGMQDVFLGWSEASGNQYAGATLASLGDVVVTNSSFFGESDIYLPEYAPQMLGLGVVGGEVVLDSSNFLPGASSLDPTDYGVNASGNGVMGALILSAGDIQIGDSVFDENGGSVAGLGLLSLLGNGVVAVGGLGGNGGTTGLWNTEANGNTSFGAVLFNTDLVGAYLGSAFDNNGAGGLLGVSLGDLELDNIDASGNTLIGAATLSGGDTSVSNSTFDNNWAGVGLLSVAFGSISAENVDASGNGILGAGLVSIDTYDLTDFVASGDSACSEDIMYPGDICVNKMTANNNGLIGAAILGTDWVEVDSSQFTGNDSNGSLAGIPGGGLVVVGGESTVLDQVTADQNFGFGAVVGNTGGVYDLLSGLLGSSNTTAGAISQAVTGSATTLDLSDLPIFTDTGDISITNSSFSNNGTFGLLSVSNGDIYLGHVKANGNGTFGASLYAEGNITVMHSTFNHNGTFGLNASIFSPDETATTGAATHTVYLGDVYASNNGDYGALIQANTTDKVDVTINHGFFNENEGAGTGGLGISTTGDVRLNGVTANHNAGDGADIFGSSVKISNSRFNYNNGYGIVINSLVHTSIIHTNACYNKLGPDLINTPDLFTSHFTVNCVGDGIGSGPTEENPLPWQIINVMMDTGKNSGTLSCLFGTTFLYLEKQTPPTPDFEWARAVLSACIVPGGSTGTFLGLAEGALPGPLPSGITFQGKAFDLSITGPNGQPIDVLAGPMMVRFTLPDGFTLPSGKKLDILWWDPAGKKWVELNTYAGGKYAWGFAGNDGTFVLTIK